MITSQYVGSGNWIRVLCRSSILTAELSHQPYWTLFFRAFYFHSKAEQKLQREPFILQLFKRSLCRLRVTAECDPTDFPLSPLTSTGFCESHPFIPLKLETLKQNIRWKQTFKSSFSVSVHKEHMCCLKSFINCLVLYILNINSFQSVYNIVGKDGENIPKSNSRSLSLPSLEVQTPWTQRVADGVGINSPFEINRQITFI